MDDDDENKEFENIVFEFSKRHLDYNYAETQRIKDRSHQIVAFFLIITSIVSASLTSISLTKLLENNLIFGILIVGICLVVLTMSLSYRIMIGKHKNYIINPKELFQLYKDESLKETKDSIRETLFFIGGEMDKRNNTLHNKMSKIYGLSIISLVIIFIPIISLIIIK